MWQYWRAVDCCSIHVLTLLGTLPVCAVHCCNIHVLTLLGTFPVCAVHCCSIHILTMLRTLPVCAAVTPWLNYILWHWQLYMWSLTNPRKGPWWLRHSPMLHPISKLLNIQKVLSWANDSRMVFHFAGRVNTRIVEASGLTECGALSLGE
jgi:hypothetical protein